MFLITSAPRSCTLDLHVLYNTSVLCVFPKTNLSVTKICEINKHFVPYMTAILRHSIQNLKLQRIHQEKYLIPVLENHLAHIHDNNSNHIRHRHPDIICTCQSFLFYTTTKKIASSATSTTFSIHPILQIMSYIMFTTKTIFHHQISDPVHDTGIVKIPVTGSVFAHGLDYPCMPAL